ncbi:MAG: polymer-forming cytoskeletal protein [Deltaproteobacteria bacterium]|nr:polymer-forming cytoskeletal protein [Deltaproteobacteria bacterium]
MKKRTDKERHSDSISTLLGEEARIEGLLDFEGTLRLDGKLEGTLTGRNGTLIVGEKAVLKAEITVKNAVIMGTVAGTVEALEKIELYPPAKIDGDIMAPKVTIEAGAILNGKCLMTSPETQKGKTASKTPTGAKVGASGDA